MRQLTEDEKGVLKFVVTDPDAWWAHANNVAGETKAEEALAQKISLRKEEVEEAKKADPTLKTKAELETEEEAALEQAYTVRAAALQKKSDAKQRLQDYANGVLSASQYSRVQQAKDTLELVG